MPLPCFCSACGHRFPPPDDWPERVLRQACARCGHVQFQNARPCAGAVVVRDGRVLLSRRGVEPYKGWWDLPGGFLEPWEHPSQAIVRELAEETGLRIRPVELLGVFVDVYRDSTDYTLNFYYLAEVVDGELAPHDDVAELAWFDPDKLPDRLAFANTRRALDAWRRLRQGERPRLV